MYYGYDELDANSSLNKMEELSTYTENYFVDHMCLFICKNGHPRYGMWLCCKITDKYICPYCYSINENLKSKSLMLQSQLIRFGKYLSPFEREYIKNMITLTEDEIKCKKETMKIVEKEIKIEDENQLKDFLTTLVSNNHLPEHKLPLFFSQLCEVKKNMGLRRRKKEKSL
jgi:hypothetical protein